jgi:hypothetical protein
VPLRGKALFFRIAGIDATKKVIMSVSLNTCACSCHALPRRASLGKASWRPRQRLVDYSAKTALLNLAPAQSAALPPPGCSARLERFNMFWQKEPVSLAANNTLTVWSGEQAVPSRGMLPWVSSCWQGPLD